VACVLDLTDYNDYEGQAAMMLEDVAGQYLIQNTTPPSYPIDFVNGKNPSMHSLLYHTFLDKKKGYDIGLIAARFHVSLVEIIRRIADSSCLHRIAFSGGVFQNALLVDLILDLLGEEYELFFHKELSPNDENISFGQCAYFSMDRELKKKKGARQEMISLLN
jgi:hydrogenase maturation protein HypF